MRYWNDPDDPTIAEGDLEEACERFIFGPPTTYVGTEVFGEIVTRIPETGPDQGAG